MSGFVDINAELERVSRRIEEGTDVVNNARELFMIAEAEFDNKFAEIQLSAKLSNPDMTQTDLKAIATRDSHMMRMTLIKAESSYKSANGTLHALQNRQEVLRELSFNLRAEAKIR